MTARGGEIAIMGGSCPLVPGAIPGPATLPCVSSFGGSSHKVRIVWPVQAKAGGVLEARSLQPSSRGECRATQIATAPISSRACVRSRALAADVRQDLEVVS